MPNLTAFTVRLPDAQVRALDARGDRSRQSRNKLISEAVELWMSLEAQRDQLARAVREATQESLSEIVQASRNTDATNRQLILDFMDVLAGDTQSPSPSGTSEDFGHVRLPDTNRR